MTTRRRTNYVHRAIGLAVAAAPLALALGSWTTRRGTHGAVHAVGLVVVSLALAVAALNFALSVLQPMLYVRKHGSREGYHHVSGFPFVGTLLMVAGVALAFGSRVATILGLVAAALDTGGVPWFVIATWRDGSLWDHPAG